MSPVHLGPLHCRGYPDRTDNLMASRHLVPGLDLYQAVRPQRSNMLCRGTNAREANGVRDLSQVGRNAVVVAFLLDDKLIDLFGGFVHRFPPLLWLSRLEFIKRHSTQVPQI